MTLLSISNWNNILSYSSVLAEKSLEPSFNERGSYTEAKVYFFKFCFLFIIFSLSIFTWLSFRKTPLEHSMTTKSSCPLCVCSLTLYLYSNPNRKVFKRGSSQSNLNLNPNFAYQCMTLGKLLDLHKLQFLHLQKMIT